MIQTNDAWGTTRVSVTINVGVEGPTFLIIQIQLQLQLQLQSLLNLARACFE